MIHLVMAPGPRAARPEGSCANPHDHPGRFFGMAKTAEKSYSKTL